MKIKNDNFVETQLKVKSTASLRQEIISELTQPDKSLELLLSKRESDETEDKQQDSYRKGA
jgi:hypothetical protein